MPSAYNNNMFAQTIPRQEVVKVHGLEGAKAYRLPENSSAILLDDTGEIVWIKATDGAGYPDIQAYTLTPYYPEQKQSQNNEDFEKRITRLEELYESYFADAPKAGAEKHFKPDKPN